jgi:hypothetical protein
MSYNDENVKINIRFSTILAPHFFSASVLATGMTGVEGVGVVVDAGELREAKGTRGGVAIPTDVMVNNSGS